MSRRRRNRIPIALLPLPGTEVMDPIFAQRRPGRPSLAPEPVLQRFLTALRAGNVRKDAAMYAGLNEQTVANWIARGRGTSKTRPATPEHTRFLRLVEEAEATAKVLVVGNLFARSRVDTAAAIFWLQNRYPLDWPKDPSAQPFAVGPGSPALLIDQRQQAVVIIGAEEARDLVPRLLAMKRDALHTDAPEEAPAEMEEPRGFRHDDLSDLRDETDGRTA